MKRGGESAFSNPQILKFDSLIVNVIIFINNYLGQ